MKRVFFGAVLVGLGLNVGVAIWDYVITPELGRFLNKRYSRTWNG